MALNIFPRREKPAAPAAEQPAAPPPPEPSPEALAEPKPRRRRAPRKAAPEQGSSEAPEAATPEPQPVATEATPAVADPPRRRRSRVAAVAETTAPPDAPAQPKADERPSQRQRTRVAANHEAAVPPTEAETPSSPRKERTPTPLPAERQLSQLANEISTLTRTLEAQAAQLAQLVRVQEDLARRVAHAPGAAPAPAPRIGVFVDAANIELALDRLKHRVNWKKMLDFLSEGRQLVRAVAYSPVHDDPGVSIETQRFAEPFLDQGYRVVTKPLRRFSDGTIKANVDIEIALDIMEMLDRLDVVVLVSGDGDFERLVEVVQSKGVRVEVVSVGSSTASNLRHAADRFVDIQAILPKVRA